MSPEERRAYVRGALSVCDDLKVPVTETALVCKDLGITVAELVEFADEVKGKKMEAKK